MIEIRQKQSNSRFLLLSFYILYAIMPIVSRAVSTFLTTYFFMLLAVWIIFTILFARRFESFNVYFRALFPFILFQMLTYFTQSVGIIMWGYNVLLFLIPVIVGYNILYERRSEIKKYSAVLLGALGITVLTTIIGLIRNPFAARVLATSESADNVFEVSYSWQNIGGYTFVYTIVLLYPLLILAFKRGKINGLLTALIAFSILAMVFLSEYTTALLLFLITSVMFLFGRRLTKDNVIVFAVIGIAVVFLLQDYFSDLLVWLGRASGSATLEERLTALAGGTQGLENSESNRLELYRMSINTFFKNPILGTAFKGGGGTGGHSQLLDALATYGLVGVAVMVWMYRYVYKVFLKPFSKNDGFGYVVWFFIQTVFLSIINTGFFFEILTLFGPILICIIYYEKEKDDEGTLDSKFPHWAPWAGYLRRDSKRGVDGSASK